MSPVSTPRKNFLTSYDEIAPSSLRLNLKQRKLSNFKAFRRCFHRQSQALQKLREIYEQVMEACQGRLRVQKMTANESRMLRGVREGLGAVAVVVEKKEDSRLIKNVGANYVYSD